MRAERRKPSSSRQAIVLLAVLGLAVPARLTSLDAATWEREVSKAGSDTGEQRPERGRALDHEGPCPLEGGNAEVARKNFKRARKQPPFVGGGCRPNATFGNAALAARDADATDRDDLVVLGAAEPRADGQEPVRSTTRA